MIDDQMARTIMTSVAGGAILEPIKHILNTWLKPKLEEMKNKNEVTDNLTSYIFDVFSDYLTRTFEYQKSVNMIALGLQQVDIDQIYIPLTIYSEEKKEKKTITKFDLKFSEKYKKIVIEDTAGMGKSTLMKKMFISAIDQNVGIPVFIELRNLSKDKDVLDVILENINPLNHIHSKDFIIEVILRGDFIFFLDGYDEISFKHKQDVTSQLKSFIMKANKNIFYLTSRLDDSLISFGQFQKFEINNLIKKESFKLFQKYDKITNLKLAPSIINQIKENINGQKFDELESFLGNPLLVSFLYLTFKHKKDIPSLKIDFYRKVYDALYELHDLSKDSYKREKYSGLSCSNLLKILNKLGFLCLRENVNDYDKNKLLKLIRNAKNSPYFNDVQEDDILRDIMENVPLIMRIGLDYKWAHKSFMEYFAAYFIDEQESREEILNNIYKSQNFSIYFNMLDFYHEIDRQLFDKVFVYPMLCDFINFIDGLGLDIFKGSPQLEYFQLVYNRVIYCDINKKLVIRNSKFDERDKYLKSIISKEYPVISSYRLNRLITSSSGEVGAIFTKSNKIDSLMKLLSNKNSILVKPLIRDSNSYTYNDALLYLTENFEIDSISDGEYEERIQQLEVHFGEANDKDLRRSTLYLDYFEAVNYKEFIEEAMKCKEDDIFYNL